MAGKGRIAIVAVHGVGIHTPGEMARDIAGLLHAGSDAPAFRVEQLDITVRKPHVPAPQAMQSHARSAATQLNFLSSDVARDAALSGNRGHEDIDFTDKVLQAVEIDTTLSQYRTVALRDVRPASGAARAVDAFELSWSDLSHLGGFIGRVAGEFYQLLFHVATLGRKAVELAYTRAGTGSRTLRSVVALQGAAETFLAGVLPVLSLALLFAALPAFPVLACNGHPVAAAIALGVAAFAMVATSGLLWTWRRQTTTGHRAGAMIVAFVVALGAGLVAGWESYENPRAPAALFAVGSVACITAYWRLVLALRWRRESSNMGGVRYTAMVGQAAWMLLLLPGVSRFGLATGNAIAALTMQAVEGLFGLLAIAWILFIIAALFTWIASGITFLAHRQDVAVRRALWTGKIAIFIPATLFFLVNVVGWQSLDKAFVALLPRIDYASLYAYPGLPHSAIFDLLGCMNTATTVAQCADALLVISVGAGFGYFAAMVGAGFVMAIVVLLPSVACELRPPAARAPGESLGTWLDAALHVLRVSGYLVLIALVIVLPGIDLWSRFWHGPAPSAHLLQTVSALVLGSTGLLVIFRRQALGGFTKVLGIALDVDNWLREHPAGQVPRGRILARYLALLEHLGREGYERVVIVSHSQGTVITTDLLRWLHARDGAAFAHMDIRLLTFGSPLRQLYGLRFPHLYEWARSEAQPASRPDRAALHRVSTWTNGYCSGDYVGRCLWQATPTWAYGTFPARPGCEDWSLGAGAHIHYFDPARTDVADAIRAQLA